MAKKEKGNKEELIVDDREILIKSCKLKDEKPEYSFERLKSPGLGDIDNIKGAALVMPDMHKAIKKLNAHLACMDDAFKIAGVEFDSFFEAHKHELTGNYSVSGFTVKGSKDDEKVSLTGKKYSATAKGWIAISTPDVLMTDHSAYTYWNELKAGIDKWRQEVERYRDGHCIPVEVEEDNSAQMSLELKEGGKNEKVDSSDLLKGKLE